MAESPRVDIDITADETLTGTALTADQEARAEALQAARAALYGGHAPGIAAPTPLLALARWIVDGDPEPETAPEEGPACSTDGGCNCDQPVESDDAEDAEDWPQWSYTPQHSLFNFDLGHLGNVKLPDSAVISEIIAESLKHLRGGGAR